MLIVLPDSGMAWEDFEARVTPAKIAYLEAHIWPQDVKVFLPRFKAESTFENLKDVIKGMGAEALFGGRADFSGMLPVGDLYASKVVQKAFIEVNEEGTEAAAPTAMVIGYGMGAIAPQRTEDSIFRADRPFMYAIVSEVAAGSASNVNIPLFRGIFRKP